MWEESGIDRQLRNYLVFRWSCNFELRDECLGPGSTQEAKVRFEFLRIGKAKILDWRSNYLGINWSVLLCLFFFFSSVLKELCELP